MSGSDADFPMNGKPSEGYRSRRAGKSKTAVRLCAIALVSLGISALVINPQASWPLIAVIIGLCVPALFTLLKRNAKVVVFIAIYVILLFVSSVVLFSPYGENNLPLENAVTVEYHGKAEIHRGVVKFDEQILFDQTTMSGIVRDADEFWNRSTRLGVTSPQPGQVAVTQPPGAISPRASRELEIGAMLVPEWTYYGLVDGYRLYTRFRTLNIEQSTFNSTNVDLNLQLGKLLVEITDSKDAAFHGHRTFHLEPRDGSTIELNAPKGAIAATYQTADVADDPHSGERALFVIGQFSYDEVSVSLLPSVLRNPAGKVVYEVASWGPLAWILGTLGLFVGGLLLDRIRTVSATAVSRLSTYLKSLLLSSGSSNRMAASRKPKGPGGWTRKRRKQARWPPRR